MPSGRIYDGELQKRVQRILRELKNPLKGVSTLRAELMEEWDIGPRAWSNYWKRVSKALERSTLRNAADLKSVIQEKLEGLLPHCATVDPETGEMKVNVQQARGVYDDIRQLQGLDSPKKVEQSTDLTLFDRLGLTQTGPLLQVKLDDQPIAQEVPAIEAGEAD